ncbi:MAG TPA: hypothetical protein DGR79_02690 [Clostridiales bacterium]|nr:hypothetical protein [Clostridiales bacterium]
MAARTGVVVFEGGHRNLTGAGALFARVRRWTTLDTLEKFMARPEVDVVVLATDSTSLAAEARKAGAEVALTGPDFHFGRVLSDLVKDHRLERVVFLGGGSVPLLRLEELTVLFELATPGERVLVSNNVQSPDILALGTVRDLDLLARAATDNGALFALCDAGYERRLLPDTSTTGFDLDTPSDILFLAYEARRRAAFGEGPRPGNRAGRPAGSPLGREGARPPTPAPALLGPRTAAGLAGLDLDLSVLERAVEVLAGDYLTVTLIGRVSGGTMNHLNANLHVRLRVFSEERGMKALGLIDRGEVKSLIGAVFQDMGLDYLVKRLEEMSDAVFWDTRVVMAHLGRWPEEDDRFEADLGRWDEVKDPELRRLTRMVRETRIPVVVGGHSVVSGGLRLLVDGLLEEGRVPPGDRP